MVRTMRRSSSSFVVVLSRIFLFVLVQQQYLLVHVIAAAAFQDNSSSSRHRPQLHQQEQEQEQEQDQEHHQHQTAMRSAWHCHGRNQRELVNNLVEAGIIRHAQVAQAMTLVDRKYYLPKLHSLYGGDASASLYPYVDAPQSIGHGQTISAPHMHAHVLEEIIPHILPRQQAQSAADPVAILDVGCGSGYLTACFGRLVYVPPPSEGDSAAATTNSSILGRPGKVYGMDIYPELVARTKQNIHSSPSDKELLDSGTIQLAVANGWDGWPDRAPFDAIHVGAAAEELPRALAQQLKVGGVLIVPIGPQGQAQILYKVERVKKQEAQKEFDLTDYRIQQLLGVQYVPLVKDL